MTASEISKQTGIATGTASTMLTKMAKAGEIVKAERGYATPAVADASRDEQQPHPTS